VGAHALDMKVLVADDDDAMRLLIEAVLATAGHEVVSAPDGDAAWAAFERERPPLMLLDWHMPKRSGIELCERVREGPAARTTFIIMITARGATDDLQRLLDAGADDYLSKPFSPEALMTRLVIAERRLMADRARREAEEALARAQWLAGIGETALALQHEINNPLAALLGNAALLTAGLAAPDEQAALITVIAEQATRIGAVVKRLASLREPRSVRYVGDSKMLDLSGADATGADAPRREENYRKEKGDN
jgi:DNA-binding response OmpR family regulator